MKVKLGGYIQEYSVRNKANEDIPVYSVTNTQGFCQDYFGKEVASKDKSTYKIVPRGYFAYNPSRINVGSVDWQRDEDQVIVSPLYNVFSVSPELNQQYLYYYLKSDFALHRIKAVATGSVRDNLKLEMLKNFPIRIPCVEEQEYIVQALDKAKNIIDLRRNELQKFDDLIRARFVEMFGDPIENPKNWKITTVGDIVTEVRYGTSKPAVEGGQYPYLRMNNLTADGHLDLHDLKYIDISDEEIEKCVVRTGDVLFNRTNSIDLVGKTALFDLPEEMVIAGYIIRVRLKKNMLPEVFSEYMNLKALKDILRSMAKGAVNQANINAQELQSIKIYLPDIELQKQFVTIRTQIAKSKHHSPHLPIPPLKWYPLPKNEVPIMEEKIIAITNEMAEVLNIAQLKKLQEVLVKAFSTEEPERKPTNHEYLRLFLEAKSIEGCSPRTLQYYEVTVQHLFAAVNLPVRKMTTERMREYLSDYQQRRNCSKATIDNIRRNISSFFSWMEEEDHILKSPMRRIHKIKTKKTVKEVISDEDIEKLRDSCTTLRDLAMIDLLYSTGIRVGELVRLNIEDVNFESRECVVFGKGDKERRVYFDAKTKIHLKNYLESRRDTNRALFVSLLAPYNRLAISGVEIRLRKMGRMLNLKSIHPHKFRRTMATRAIDKGMPIEQVQKILGHSQIDTTMQYAIVNQNNVKMSHQKYIA